MNKVLVFGSINLDHTYELDHIVQPGETISSMHYRTAWGGKGLNQATALAKAGAEVYLAGQIAAEEKQPLHEQCAGVGLRADYVRTVNAPAGHAIIQVDAHGQNSIIVLPGANGCIEDATIDEALRNFGPGDVVLLQNEINRLEEIIPRAKAQGITVAFNPSPCKPNLQTLPLEQVDLFILNEVEGAVLSGETEPDRILDVLAAKFPASAVLLTLGADGSRFRCGDETDSAQAVRVQAVDTTAAGDTYTGYFLAGRLQGLSVADAMQLASRASAIAVTRKGAADSIPTPDELK